MKTSINYSKDEKKRIRKKYRNEYANVKDLNKSNVNIKNIKTLYNIFSHTQNNNNVQKNINNDFQENDLVNNNLVNNKIHHEESNDIYKNEYDNRFKKFNCDNNYNSYSDFVKDVDIHKNVKIQTQSEKHENNFFNKIDFFDNGSKDSNVEYFYKNTDVLKNKKINYEENESVSNKRNFKNILDLKNFDDYKKFIHDNNKNILYLTDNASVWNKELKLSFINEKNKEYSLCNNNKLNKDSVNETSYKKDFVNLLDNEVPNKDAFSFRKLKKDNFFENDIIIDSNLNENFDLFNFDDNDNKNCTMSVYNADEKGKAIKENIDFVFKKSSEEMNETNDFYNISENFSKDEYEDQIFNNKKKNYDEHDKYSKNFNKYDCVNENEIKNKMLFLTSDFEQINIASINEKKNVDNDLINLKKNREDNTEDHLTKIVINGEENQKKKDTNYFDEFFSKEKNIPEIREKENNFFLNNLNEENYFTNKLDVFICDHFYKNNFDFDSSINENLEREDIIEKDNNLNLVGLYTKKDSTYNDDYLISNIDVNKNNNNWLDNSNNVNDNNINLINKSNSILDSNNKLYSHSDSLIEEYDFNFYKKNLNISNDDNSNRDRNINVLEINTSLDNQNFKNDYFKEYTYEDEKNKKIKNEIESYDKDLFISNSNKIYFENINKNNNNMINKKEKEKENLNMIETTFSNSYEKVVNNINKMYQNNSNVINTEFDKNFYNSKVKEKYKDIIELGDYFFLPGEIHKKNENILSSDKNYEEFSFEISNDNNKVNEGDINYQICDKKIIVEQQGIDLFEEQDSSIVENKNFIYENNEENIFEIDISKKYSKNNTLNKKDSIQYLENGKEDENDSKIEVACRDYYIEGKNSHEIIIENENTSFYEIIEEIENVSKDIIGDNINEENIYENEKINLSEYKNDEKFFNSLEINENENDETQGNSNDELKTLFDKNNFISETIISDNINKKDSVFDKKFDDVYAYFDNLSDCNKKNVKNDVSFKAEEENKYDEIKKGSNNTINICKEMSNYQISNELLNYIEIENKKINNFFVSESNELFNEHVLKSFDTIYEMLMTKNYLEHFSVFYQNDKLSYTELNIPNFQIYLKKIKNIMKSGFNEMYDYNDFIHKFINEIFNMDINDFFFFNIYVDNMNKYINKKNILINNISNTHHFINDFYKKHEKILTLEVFYKNMSYSLYFLVFINLLIELWYILIFDIKKKNYDKLLSTLINYLNKKRIVYVLRKIYNYLHKIYEELNKSTIDEKQKKIIVKIIKKSKSFKLIKRNIYKINNCCFNLLIFFLPLSIPPFKKKINIFDNLLNYFFKNINKIIFKYIKDDANESFEFNTNNKNSKIFEDNFFIQEGIYNKKEEYANGMQSKDIIENVSDSKNKVEHLNDSKDKIEHLNDSKDKVEHVNDSKDRVENVNDSKDKVENVNDSKDKVEYVNDSKDKVEYVNDSKDKVENVNDSKDKVEYVNDSKDKVENVNDSKDKVENVNDSKDRVESVSDPKEEKHVYDLNKKKINVEVLKEEKISVDSLKEEKENASVNCENEFSKRKNFFFINNNIERKLNKNIKDIIDNIIKNCKKNICLLKIKNLQQLFLYCFENPHNEKYINNLTNVVRDLKISEKIEIIEKQLESYIKKNTHFYHIFFKIVIPGVNAITNIFENLETLFTLYINYKIKKKKKLFYFYDPWIYSYDAFLSFSQLDEIKLSDEYTDIFHQTKKKKKKRKFIRKEDKENVVNNYIKEVEKTGLNSSEEIKNIKDFKIYFKKIDEKFLSKNIFDNLTNFYRIRYIKQLLLFVKNEKKIKKIDEIKNNINNTKLKVYYSYILKLCYNENYIKINTRALKYLFFHLYFN
ncbi:conserved Plasmodium protein, unknown function [Plasmodium relictum]|uniref:Uncharacterized protein n=1 Tax=Plasmodium relictum TaxID=85471 RepID=A0A1J1H105_PLARL|nr:conserved Plasmodium protein, unknown function [Plasmodium relictum]CRG98601.1 conserved Plasmodium protein, unknown function [Plasmodium relictum]